MTLSATGCHNCTTRRLQTVAHRGQPPGSGPGQPGSVPGRPVRDSAGRIRPVRRSGPSRPDRRPSWPPNRRRAGTSSPRVTPCAGCASGPSTSSTPATRWPATRTAPRRSGRTLSRRVAELADDPRTPAVLRQARLRRADAAEEHRGTATTSAGGTSPTTPASRWCWTGGRRSRARSTRRARATRRAWRCAAASASTAEPLTSFEDEHLDRGEELGTGRRRSSPPRSNAPASARCATSSPPSSRIRTSWSAPTWTRRSACRVHRAPGRRRWACTVPRTCSTCTGSGCAGPASWWSGRTGRSCTTSRPYCRRSARSRSSSPPWTTC